MPGDDLDPDGRIPGCPPTWDLCWPVAELAACHDDEVPGALARYSEARLPAAIRHVTRSEQATAAYLARAATRTEA